MNNLDDRLLLLLVYRQHDESAEDLFAFLQRRYDARLQDSELGPLYKIGPTYFYHGQKFSKICTFAGSLMIRVIFDTRQTKFDRPVIYRSDSNQRFRLLSPGGPEIELDENGLAESENG